MRTRFSVLLGIFSTLMLGTLLITSEAAAVDIKSDQFVEPDANVVGKARRTVGSQAAGLELSYRVAGSALWQGTLAAAVDGDHAYVFKYYGLEVVDIANPAAPQKIGEYFFPSIASKVIKRGDFLYVAANRDGLLIFDVTDPASPVLSGQVTVHGLSTWGSPSASSVALDGSRAYVSADQVFMTVDISNPYAPVRIGNFEPDGLVQETVVAGNFAYMAAGYYFSKWDITNPEAPVLGKNWHYSNDANQAVLSPDQKTVYISDARQGIYAYDISGANTHPLIGSYIDTSQSWGRLAMIDNKLYSSTRGKVRILDLPAANTIVPAGEITTGGTTYDISADPSTAVLADWFLGVDLYDITDPSNPTLTGNYPTPGIGFETVVDGNYAYEANGLGGLKVIDLTDPEHLSIAVELPLPGEASTVARVGNYLYLGNSYTLDLTVVDVSVPASPTIVNQVPLFSQAWKVFAHDTRVYLGTDSSLMIFDVSTPSSPTLLGSINLHRRVTDIETDGNMAYVNTQYAYLTAVDISDPQNPMITGEYQNPSGSSSLALSGNYVYQSVGFNGDMTVFDVSDPFNPTPVATISEANDVNARNMHAVGNYLYVAAYMGGVRVYNISDPLNVTPAGYYDPNPGWARDVDLANGVMYVTSDNGFTSVWQDGCGGPDGGGEIDMVDLSYLVDFFFNGGPGPVSDRMADLDCSGDVSPVDLSFLVEFLFSNGTPPCGGCY